MTVMSCSGSLISCHDVKKNKLKYYPGNTQLSCSAILEQITNSLNDLTTI